MDPVRALALSPGDAALYVGGLFETYGTLTRHGLIKANPLTGAPNTAFNANFRADSGVGTGGSYDGEAGNVLQVTPDGTRLLVGVAGQGSDVFKVLNPTTGANTWVKVLPGDTQAVAIVGTTYIVGYHNKGGSTVPYPYFAAQLESTNSQLTTWDPGLTGFQSNADGGNNGVQAMYADPVNRRLFVAGAFTTENGRPQKSLAVYTWGAPVNRPPVASFTSSASGQTVSFSGAASSDPDGSIASWSWEFGDSTQGSGATVQHTYPAAGTYTVTLRVTDNQAATGTRSAAVAVVALPPDPPPTTTPPPPSPITPAPTITPVPPMAVDPARLVETRTAPEFVTVDHQLEHIGHVAAGSTLTVQIAGRGGVPANTTAAFLNITAIAPDAPGYLTVHPCNSPRPNASNVNYATNDVIPNAVLAKLDPTGTTCVYTSATTDIIIDANGYVAAAGSPSPVDPARLVETRTAPEFVTVDHQLEHIGHVAAGSTLTVQIAGRGGVPANATAAFLNITAIAPDAPGYLTVHPCNSPRPNASNVNYATNDVIPNAVLAKLDPTGTTCVYTSATTDIIIDANGYVAAAGSPSPVDPARLVETRTAPEFVTVDHQLEHIGHVAAGSTLTVQIAGRGGVPANATAAFLNITAIAPDAPGYLTVHPCNSPRPNASNVNYATNDVIPNAVLAKLDPTGTTCVYTSATTDIIIDANGSV